MNKKTLLTLLLPIFAVSLNACGSSKEILKVDTSNMLFINQVKGTSFDATGLEVYFESHDMNGRVGRREVEYTLDAPEVIEGDSWEATVHVEGQDDVTISGGTREKVKVACVGDSLTYGHIWQSEAYPVFLQDYLGNERFEIRNFGINGVSITGYGGTWDDPNERYILKQEYTDSKNYQPDVIVMCLGTNDGTNWTSAAATFVDYYHTLIDGYKEALPNAQWVFMVSPPCKEPNDYGIDNEAMREHVNPVQRSIA